MFYLQLRVWFFCQNPLEDVHFFLFCPALPQLKFVLRSGGSCWAALLGVKAIACCLRRLSAFCLCASSSRDL